MAGGGRSREGTTVSEAPLDGELDLGAVGRALWRKKLWVLVPAAIVAALAFAAVNMITPRYKSEARVILEGRENVFLRPEAEKGGDRDRLVVDQEAVTSQVQLALSRDVAREVIKKLNLAELPEFDPVLRGVGPLRNILILLGIARDPLRMSPEERVFESYYARVQAFQVEKSRVIAIEFQSADPELAARGANAVAEAYIALLQVVKQDQTRAAGQWLAGEIEELRKKVAEAEAKVEQFRAKHNLLVGSNNNTLSNQELGEVNSQLAAARAQQAEADAKARSIREMLRAGRPVEAGDIINSELIRRLNEQRVTLRAQLAEQSSTLLGSHPRIKELRAQIADLERQIRNEAERLVRALENDAQIAGARVEQLRSNLDALKRQAAVTNENDALLRAMEREAKAQRDLLESYLAKYREAAARENLAATPADARIISRAIVSNTPYFPKKLPIILIATFATLLLGAGFITTGELLAGNVYRPGGVAMSVVSSEEVPARQEAPALVPEPPAQEEAEEEPAPPAAPPQQEAAPEPSGGSEPLPDEPVKAAVETYVLAAAADRLRAQADGRSRSAVVGLSPDLDTGARAIALGRLLSAHGRAIVIDLDFAGALSEGDEQAGPCGIADLVRGKAAFGEIIGRDGASPAHVVPAGHVGGDGLSVLASERLTIALDALERTYEHVVMDLGCLPQIDDARLARLAPSVLVLAPADMLPGFEAIAESLRQAGCRTVLPLSDGADPDLQLAGPVASAAA